MEHIIQLRVTRTRDKHVCKVCGKDAYLRGVTYEVASQEVASQLEDEFHQAKTWEQLRDVPRFSSVNDAILTATVEEQRARGPQEHARLYQCASCFGTLLSLTMGNTGGSHLIEWLSSKPLLYAIFGARKIDGQCLLVAAKSHDPLHVLASLERGNAPHLRVR